MSYASLNPPPTLQSITDILQQLVARFDSVDARLDAVESRLDAMDTRLGVMDGRLDAMDTRLDVMDGRLDAMDTRLGVMDGRLNAMDTRLDVMDGRLNHVDTTLTSVLERLDSSAELQKMRSINACRGPFDELVRPTMTYTGRPMPSGVAIPNTWADLAVAGNEIVPGANRKCPWNKRKSRDFLRAFYEADPEQSDSDAESEYTPRARRGRLQVAEAMGIGTQQLGSFAAVCNL
jgi:hypothetical protein